MFSQLWRRLTGAREPSATVAATAAPEAIAATVAVPEAAAATPAPTPEVATEASLHRSLNWRARVLLEGATREGKASDGPELVEALRTASDSVIRQPPIAAQQALRVASDPNSPVSRVTTLFENDPMLAQGLLRQANSIYYRRDSTPCTSLNTGVQRVGMKGVQGVLMASMVQQMLCRPGGAYDTLVQKVWSHMQRTAPVARAIAPAFGVDPETSYSLALLHDVGKLVIFDHVSRLRHEHRREVKMPDLFFRQLLAHLHEPLGGLAVMRWDLGADAARAVAEHHRRPLPAGPDLITECLYVAECVELAHTNFTKLDWEKIWEDGGITTDVVQVQERLAQMEE
jgi:HD-like signal output (HDOD) protein